ncbi:MAG: Glu-tRNA(Gln) amidotransferase subunit GatE [Candidatus Woesearchaeota archaeon]|jgi:glutamyl-tRNA(Gln) amidotransferase subunit E|nr:Glu-tRNA(Gln) amidotransferase subunit GatE [Candidatus Woesearchaeota archaeon]
MSKLIFLDRNKCINYTQVGLMCGIEIHQQLNTGKLFCSCPCLIEDNKDFDKEIKRKLRFSLSETGDVDRAAAEEFRKDKFNEYKYNDKIACLVDLDEEPPKGPNKLAFDAAVKAGIMLNLNFFNKTQFMRKLIIDGSVVSGFQRTAMLGFGGSLKTSFGEVSIEGVNIEEDSSRAIERLDGHNIYSLDRQGIPLIEITTGPDIRTPEQGFEVAEQIGNLLRSFSTTRRGLGTIRQDVNVSIKGGSRIEIKGAQNLKLIPEMIKDEIRRQQIHLSIIEELKSRGVGVDNFSDKKVYDVSKVFEKTTSKVVLGNLTGKTAGIFAIKLNKFEGILGHEMQDNYRFATEVSDRNKKHFPQIKGLFHSDELPKYGIEQNEVDLVRKELGLGELDSFILIVNDKNIAQNSLKNVLEIIKELLVGVPTEVRQVDSKGTVTVFSRPMPGAARMYPETDIEEIEITKEYLDEEEKKLPELYNKKLDRLKGEFDIENARIEEMLSSYSEDQIRSLIKISKKNAATIYNLLFDLPKDIRKRESIEPINLNYELLENIIKASSENLINQKIIRDLFISLYKENLSNVSNLKDYLEERGLVLESFDEAEVEKKIREIVTQNSKAPFGALMGMCMNAFEGKVDGKVISSILKKLN